MTLASTKTLAATAAPTLADVFAARGRIRPHLQPTPLVDAPALAEHLGLDVRLKLETVLPIGAFKVRGGINLVAAIEQGLEDRPRGFVTASTGNHGQSIAYASRLFGYPAVVYAPEDCNPYKAEAMRRFEAEVILTGRDYDDAREAAENAARERGYRYVPPIEPLLISGVATATLELLEQWPELDAIVVPLGGGSGACGACVAGKGIKPTLEVIAVQAAGAPAFYRSWKSGQIETTDGVQTFAEGLATRVAYELSLKLLGGGALDDVVLVSDTELERAMVELLRQAHVLAEAAGAAGVAAATQPAIRERLVGKRVALMVTGANVTPETLRRVLEAQV